MGVRTLGPGFGRLLTPFEDRSKLEGDHLDDLAALRSLFSTGKRSKRLRSAES